MVEEITSNAIAFKEAIVATLEAGKLPDTMGTFPRGCCGDSSMLLGTYLTEKGFGDFTYVCGERGRESDGNWSSHAWLCLDSLIIDITKSQFRDCPDEITVTEGSKWHDSFRITDTFPAYIKGTGDSLELVYGEILGFIDKT